MKITVITEDTEGLCPYFEHGLCVYIGTEKHRMLVDTGASDLLIKNAEILGIDLKSVDSVFLSHGHYDHSGGIIPFAKINKNAKIYVHEKADLDYYNLRDGIEKYIGIDKSVMSLSQTKIISGTVEIDSEITVFDGSFGDIERPSGNKILKIKTENGYKDDVFDHEQYISVVSEGKKILVSGCAHNGITNILRRYETVFGCQPDIVISGFHMMKKTELDESDIELIKRTANELNTMNTVFYTGHCTGEPAFEIMKKIMGEKLKKIHSGEKIGSQM